MPYFHRFVRKVHVTNDLKWSHNVGVIDHQTQLEAASYFDCYDYFSHFIPLITLNSFLFKRTLWENTVQIVCSKYSMPNYHSLLSTRRELSGKHPFKVQFSSPVHRISIHHVHASNFSYLSFANTLQYNSIDTLHY